MKKSICLFFILVFLTGCTTAMWDKPVAMQSGPDTFKFTIYLGGLAGEETAFEKLQYEVNKFELQNDYSGYKIIGEKRDLFPGHQIDYVVRFIRNGSK